MTGISLKTKGNTPENYNQLELINKPSTGEKS